MKSNPQVYPLTARLESEADELKFAPEVSKTVEILLRTFGEYEHGSADPDDIHPKLTLEMLHNVYSDLLLTLSASEQH